MSESDTMFNERNRRCTAVQLMLSTYPSCDNRTFASTLKMQIRTVQLAPGDENKVSSYGYGLWCGFKWRPHHTTLKSAWKSTPKCTWMCWRVWWFSGAIRWPVADPGCGSRTHCRPTSPKRPRFGFRRSATTFYPSLNGPTSSPNLNPLNYFPPALVEKQCSQFRIRIEAVIVAEGGYIE